MNQTDMRHMLAEVFNVLSRLLPIADEAFVRSHAVYQATASQDPKRALLIDSHFQRLSKSSKQSVEQALLIIESYKAKLDNDALWNS